MHFWKSYICSNQLDVQETNFSFTQFNSSLDAGLTLDGITALDLWDLIVAVLGNTYQNNQERGDPCRNLREVRAAPHKIQKTKTFSWNY